MNGGKRFCVIVMGLDLNYIKHYSTERESLPLLFLRI